MLHSVLKKFRILAFNRLHLCFVNKIQKLLINLYDSLIIRLNDEKDRETFINILSDNLGSYFDQTFHNICANKQPPIFG